MADRPIYPFTALVGQDRMQTALLLHAVHPGLGGVLVRGQKGTAKSTAVRALASLLPVTDSVADCPFGCDPADPGTACDTCSSRLTAGQELPFVKRAVPVVELPLGATEDRVLGSLDLETAIQSGKRRFEPGLLARANRGILYVDEVNLLADHLVDIVLDAAAMGTNYVEREGVSVSHPSSFMLIGTMNPEEGDLRPQLLDRFALTVEVEGLRDPLERAEAVRRRIAFEGDPTGFVSSYETKEEEERSRLARARALLPRVGMPGAMLELIVKICSAFEVDGLRADLAIYRTATALAAYAGRLKVDSADVHAAAELALPHRRRRRPFEETGLDAELLEQLVQASQNQDIPPDERNEGDCDRKPSASQGADGETSAAHADPAPTGSASSGTQSSSPPSSSSSSSSSKGEARAAPGAPLGLSLPLQKRKNRRSEPGGRRPATDRDHRGSPSVDARPVDDRFELALAATLRAAAIRQTSGRPAAPGPFVRILPPDLRERLRSGRASSLVLFVVDASGSMGARDRMAATKSAVLSLLADAYRKRDKVGLIAFRGQSAELLLPPTNSVVLAERRLRLLPTGGRTPLAAGLALGQTTIEHARAQQARITPLLVLVSDGRANVSDTEASPWTAALLQAEHIQRAGWEAVVLDTDKGRSGAGLGRALAGALGAKHLILDDYMIPPRFSTTDKSSGVAP